MMHPSEEIFCAHSTALRGKTVILGITGSIAAVECFALTRDLIRHGAKVVPVMTQAATDMVTPMAMEFASGRTPIVNIGGQAEHVNLISEGEGGADLLLIYPASANTVSKVAQGIDDTAVTSMATVAIGAGTPVIMAPAMHNSMYRNPAVQRNIGLLQDMGVILVGPKVEDLRAKAADRGEVLAATLRALGRGDLSGRRLLVIGGRGEEEVDDMRMLSNRSSGMMALELGLAAHRRGADVEVWMGGHDVSVPSHLNMRRFASMSDLMAMIPDADHDIVLVPAALPDFSPERMPGKIDSSAPELTLRFKRMQKALPLLVSPGRIVVGFKAESGADDAVLEERARSRLKEYGLDLVVANDVSAAGKGMVKVLLVDDDGCQEVRGNKSHIADSILDRLTGTG